jgi:hypothetical protein
MRQKPVPFQNIGLDGAGFRIARNLHRNARTAEVQAFLLPSPRSLQILFRDFAGVHSRQQVVYRERSGLLHVFRFFGGVTLLRGWRQEKSLYGGCLARWFDDENFEVVERWPKIKKSVHPKHKSGGSGRLSRLLGASARGRVKTQRDEDGGDRFHTPEY